MDYFPAFLKLDARSCLLVGGGDVATRKARLLLAAGARLTVVAPDCSDELAGHVASGKIRHIARTFAAGDVDGHWLVVSATNDAATQALVKRSADAIGVFCNSVDDIANSSYINPAVVDRSPVVIAISSGGAAPVLARKIRAQLEALIPAATGKLAAVANKWRTEASRRIKDSFGRRRFWERVFDGEVVRIMQSVGSQAANDQIGQLLHQASSRHEQRGEAWLVGAGPGDPELLTLRALQLMQSADVILHDRLVSNAILDLSRRDAERISVGKIPGCTKNTQEDISALLVSLVASGKRVCRLKGGDPFIFGRGGEEVEALVQAGLPYQVVPGITAAAGCAAYSGIPLTHRDASQSVMLVTGHGKDSIDSMDWPSLARDRQTLAIYMGVQRFPDIMKQLTVHGRSADTPVAIIEKGTTPEQRVIRGSLGQLTLLADAHKISAPAMLIVGEVARLGQYRDSHKRDSKQTIRGRSDDLRQYSANNR